MARARTLRTKWGEISTAIQDVLDFVHSKTFIQCDKALPSYLVLIPLIYVRYHFVNAWNTAKDVDSYLIRCSLAGAFSGQPDNLIDALVKKFSDEKAFNLDDAFELIRNQGRSLELTEERFWQSGYAWRSFTELYLDSTGAFRDAVIGILAAVANQERVRRSERTRAGLERTRTQGKRLGRRRVDVDAEQVRSLRSQGLSWEAISQATGFKRSTCQRAVRG